MYVLKALGFFSFVGKNPQTFKGIFKKLLVPVTICLGALQDISSSTIPLFPIVSRKRNCAISISKILYSTSN